MPEKQQQPENIVFAGPNGSGKSTITKLVQVERKGPSLRSKQVERKGPSLRSKQYAKLSSSGRYTIFAYNDMVITFMHGKDLVKYLAVKKWDNGYLVVECLGKIKGEYEDYIDLSNILENLYMDPEECFRGIQGVVINGD